MTDQEFHELHNMEETKFLNLEKDLQDKYWAAYSARLDELIEQIDRKHYVFGLEAEALLKRQAGDKEGYKSAREKYLAAKEAAIKEYHSTVHDITKNW